MGRLGFEHHGNWTDTEKYFELLKSLFQDSKLDKYGEMGVKALEEATPKKTGLTSRSWYYEIIHDPIEDTITISWNNDNFQQGQHIALILQEGHATRGGGYFEGIDYINPALKPIFKQIEKEAIGEVFGIL